MARLPQLWGVLYAEPNADGQRKACANCMFTDKAAQVCQVIDAPISPEMVCGYHIERGVLANAELAGLETVPGGTSCDTCKFFRALGAATPMTALGGGQQPGVCVGTEDENGGPATVSPMGCCARWES